MNAPLVRLLAWLIAWPQLSVLLLVAVLVGSALGVIYSAHETRHLYAQMQTLHDERDFLDSEYEKLLLEQGAWADYSRVDQLSRSELNMASPDADKIVVVQR